VTVTFVMERLKEAFDDATGKWDPIISKAVENATFKWGFPPSGGNAGGEVSYSHAVSVSESGSIGPRRATLYISYKYHDPKATGRRIHQTDWDVPADFDFPTADLYVAWTAWLLGHPSNQSKKADGVTYPAPVRPLCLLRHHGKLPAFVKKKFDNAWRPILELMDAEVAATIAQTPVTKIDHAFISATYAHALKNICLRNPDIAPTLNRNRQAVSTCSKALKSISAKKRKSSQM